jgi:hypothetical protein
MRETHLRCEMESEILGKIRQADKISEMGKSIDMHMIVACICCTVDVRGIFNGQATAVSALRLVLGIDDPRHVPRFFPVSPMSSPERSRATARLSFLYLT